MSGTPLQIRMLVVDDDDVDRERVLRMLARSPLEFHAVEAASGADALRLVREYAFDCVMLDNQLGDASGAELLPTLNREARCPVIMVTGAGNELLAVQALQEGAADYLSKFQLDAESLVRAIRRALEHHKMRRELDDLHQRLEERVETQAAEIRQRERDLQAILDHTPSVIGYWDANLRNRFGNRAYRTWLGIDPESLPGRHLREVIGEANFAMNRTRLEAVLRGEPQSFEQEVIGPDGVTTRYGQQSLFPDIADDGVVKGFYSTITDVTANRRAQAHAEELAHFVEAVIENSPVGIAVYRAGDGQCVLCNSALAGLIGADADASRALDLRSLVTGQAPDLMAAADATLVDGRPRLIDVEARTPFGRMLRADCAVARVDREGAPHLLLIAHDTTEQRRAHDALVTARDAAEHAARIKSSFLANMSHEIRTPMNAIIGLSRLALDDSLPPTTRDYLDKVHTSAVALMGILDDVLDYSKIEAGQMRFERVPMHLEQIVQRVADLFAARLDQKGLEFIVDMPHEVPRRVLGDSLRLSQVLNNLVGNAVKFTERGHVKLAVRILHETPEGLPGMLRFSVRDTGIGVAPERRTTLFESFAQGDSSITRRFGGTGLGLAISRRLVELMGGQIGIESDPAQGSEFWFTASLPRVESEVPAGDAALLDVAEMRMLDADRRPASTDMPHTPPWERWREPNGAPGTLAELLQQRAAPLRGARVLLVEDNPLNQTVARQFLERMGIEVQLADDGALALAAVADPQGVRFDAVLMDLHMPVMDGLEATRRIRARPDCEHLPVIGMTAAALPEDRASCLAAGMTDYLAKPITPERLLAILLKWIADGGRAADALPPSTVETPAGAPAASASGAGDAALDVDFSFLRDQLLDNQAALRRVLVRFIELESDTARVLAQRLADADMKGAQDKAHDLKGAAATLGLLALSRACAELESQLRCGQLQPDALERVREALESGLRAARSELASPGGA